MPPAGLEPATLQSQLDDAGGESAGDARVALDERFIGDPVTLLAHLDASGHFHRDGRVGRVFHRGMISLRENVANDSLHVSVDGNRMTAHVDEVSPLALEPGGRSGYTARRAVKHNLSGIAGDLRSLVRGRQGDHTCVLDCEWGTERSDEPLLDPGSCAWSVQLEARVSGSLDEGRLRAAVGTAAGVACERFEVAACRDDAALDAARERLQSVAVGAGESPPFAVCLARHPAGDILMLNLNHAAADGAGALRVLRAIAGAYAEDAAGAGPLHFLASRELPVRPAPPSTSIGARAGRGALGWLRDLLSRTTGLAPEEPEGDAGYGVHLVSLAAPEAPTGDILMAALHLTIGAWNLEHGARDGGIGVLVPADLRPPDWQHETIGNVSVTARVSTNRRERAHPGSALRAVVAQTARNQRTRTGIALIAGLQRAGLLALWAKQSVVVLAPLTSNRLVDAGMLCDLGAIGEAPRFDPGAGETVALAFSTPARSPQSLSLGAVTADGRLHLTFRYPRRMLGARAARRFAESYLGQLRLVQRSAPPGRSPGKR